MYSMYDDDVYCPSTTPKTLGDWVKNFRIKKLQMKRRLRAGNSNLRVCAILSTALLSAENQLRLKQQERLNRCLQLQSKFHEKLTGAQNRQQFYKPTTNNSAAAMQRLEPDAAAVTPAAAAAAARDNAKSQAEAELKRRIEISNLWREELNGLDNLLRKTSTSSNNNSSSSGGGGNSIGGSCAEAANQRFGESDEANMLKSIAVLS